MKKKRILTKLDFADVKHDLCKFPWPYKDSSVEEAVCSYKLQFIPAKFRIRFMEELWRILVLGGKATLLSCYWSSPRAIQDPALEWPPICEQSFLYFNKGWRENNKLPKIGCNFGFTFGYQLEQETISRQQDVQSFWVKHYINTVNDLQVVVTKEAI